VLQAHGYNVARERLTGLTTECRQILRRIDLHWHDLRHEYASRLVEKGARLSQVRDLLGHASITTTERMTTSDLKR
jgi:site-specific recombinase XerD